MASLRPVVPGQTNDPVRPSGGHFALHLRYVGFWTIHKTDSNVKIWLLLWGERRQHSPVNIN
jgi:hypothetical protein